MERCSTVIEGALVIDGSGAPGSVADVAIDHGRIIAIGALSDWRADQRIDGSGQVLAPGFIDVHTHDDVALLKARDLPFKVSQGVTTVIGGNCGISVAPLSTDTKLPPPFPLLGDDIDFQYPTVADYRAKIEALPPAVNVALLVGHSSLRVGAMGSALDQPAGPDAIEEMSAQLDLAMRQGCIGMSSGLAYPPAQSAPIEELVTLASVLRRYRGSIYTTHMRDESDGVIEAVRETLETGRRSGVAVVISHHKCAGPRNYGRSVETLDLIERAQAGQDVALDVYPYTASSTSLLPQFIRDSEAVLVTWSESHPECGGRMLNDIAADWNCDAEEAAACLEPAGAIYFQMDEEDLRRILGFPSTMIGSDGLPGRQKPHPRLWGTFPRVLSRYVRQQKLISLPAAIHKMTGLSAETFGLTGRGLIREGFAADLVLFDPDTIDDLATFEDSEVPSAGISYVLVNGELTRSQGESTGVYAGRFLTH